MCASCYSRREEVLLSFVWETFHEKWSSQQTRQTSSRFHSRHAPHWTPHCRSRYPINKRDCDPSPCYACWDPVIRHPDNHNSYTNNHICQATVFSQRWIFILKPLISNYESLSHFWHCTYISTAFFTAIYSKYPKGLDWCRIETLYDCIVAYMFALRTIAESLRTLLSCYNRKSLVLDCVK